MSTVFLPLEKNAAGGKLTAMAKTVADRIKKRLKAVGMSAQAASLAAGMSKDGIRNIFRKPEQTPQGRNLIPLAEVLETTVSWLLKGEGPETLSSHSEERDTSVPILAWISAGKLVGADARDDNLGHIDVAKLGPGDWIAMKVQGDSMDRISPPDSIILVNRSETRLVPNACYVVDDGEGGSTYKRYRPNPMRFEPVSTNPAHEAIFPENEPLVVGRVRRTILDM